MKDRLRDVIDYKLNKADNENRIREFIQEYLLHVLYKGKIFQNLVFTGGTALRFLYNIRRYSEDIDFSLSFKARDYDFLKILSLVKREFELAGYNLEIKYSMESNVHSAFLKFIGLLHEFQLSPIKDKKIAIKLEIDTNPPKGGREEVDVYNRGFMFYVLHFDLASLFAGKLHALLCRRFTKGRDWYDLLWYLTKSKNIEPNFIMLNNAIEQTCKEDIGLISQDNWKKKLEKEIRVLNIEKVRNDVFIFLEDKSEINLLNKENLLNILNKKDY
jgi:predicted nucleotidyltransferase component of viral defense system